MHPDRPFSAAKFPFFYGWMVLLWSAIGVIMSLPGQTMGVGVFTDDLMQAGGLGRLELSVAYMAGTIVSSFFLPRAGRLYDRLGARRMAPGISLCLGAVLCCLPFLPEVKLFSEQTLPTSISRVIPFCFLTACFLGLRFFGQGTLTMVSKNMTLKWFVKRKGMANGVLGIAVSFGFSCGVVGMNQVITAYGWQTTLYLLAVLIGLAFSFCAYVFYRDSPQECGLLPDGKSGLTLAADTCLPPRRDSTLPEAQSTFAFWWFSLALALIALLHTAISFHIISLFASAGVGRDDAVKLFFHMAIVGTLVTIAVGWLSDHIELKYLLAVMTAGMCITCTVLLDLEPPMSRYLLALGMGIGQGCFGILSSVTWPHFFGLTHLGAITGVVTSLLVFGSALGPALYGVSEYFFGTYTHAHILCLIASVIMLLGASKAEIKSV